jgi:D-alanyl-D-alanine carboxypeptidase (penicillin-binding protein 5/6)
MHVIEPAQFKRLPKKHRTKKLLIWLVVFMLFASFAYGILLYIRPLPPVNAQKVTIPLPAAQNVNLTWPGYGQAAIAAEGFGLLANHGSQTPAPTASTAKLITAVALLRQKPIADSQNSPVLTLDAQDVDLYNDYYARGGSVVAVQEGEKITQYQAMQALLLPSANNMAASLVRWAFGSVDNYVAYANKMVATLGMNNTHVADASGFSPETTSTATDLVTLAQVAMKEPVIAQIVSQKEATIPVDGVITNTNWLLGQEGIMGIKTGNTDEAGGCFILAATHSLAQDKSVTIVSAIMGAPTLAAAINDSLTLLKSSYDGFKTVQVLKKNQPVATYQTAWGSTASAVMAQDVVVVSWIGRPISSKTILDEVLSPAKKAQQTARVQLITNGSDQVYNAYLNQPLTGPSLWWRLTRPSS